jgi:hypothetical protein
MFHKMNSGRAKSAALRVAIVVCESCLIASMMDGLAGTTLPPTPIRRRASAEARALQQAMLTMG